MLWFTSHLILKNKLLSFLILLLMIFTIWMSTRIIIFYYLMFLNSSYFTETQLTDLCIPPPLYVHLDIRSLPSNYDKFIHYLSSLQDSVITLSETRLTEASKEMYTLKNCDVDQNVRRNRRGVCLFI